MSRIQSTKSINLCEKKEVIHMKHYQIVQTDIDYYNKTPSGEWLDSHYQDEDTGEDFFVELRKASNEDLKDFIFRCDIIARENFDNPVWVQIVTYQEAEVWGYDTY